MNRGAIAAQKVKKEALHKTASSDKVWSGHRSIWTGPLTHRPGPTRRKIGRWILLLAALLALYIWRLGC